MEKSMDIAALERLEEMEACERDAEGAFNWYCY